MFAGAAHRVELPVELCERARDHSRAAGVTLFATLLAAYVTLLHRIGGQPDLCVGSAFANRQVPGSAEVLGMFVNPVTLRFDLTGDLTFEALVAQAAEVALGAQNHQELPFTQVVEALGPARSPGRNPLFAAMFNVDDAPLAPLDFGDVHATYLERQNHTAKVDLSVLVVPRAERQTTLPSADRPRGITMIWEHRTDLLTQATVARFAAQFEALLDAALAAPATPVAELPVSGSPTPVQVLFERHAAAHPQAVAVRLAGGGRVTYGDLNDQADHIAHTLTAGGIGPEDIVGLWLDRGLTMPAAVLGVLKSGAAYLPLDPAGPPGRHAPATLILTSAGHQATAERLNRPVVVVNQDRQPPVDRGRPPVADPANAAYLITTSGSTGEPKSVICTHGGLAAEYRAWEEAYRLEPGAHAQLASFVFDVCTGDLVRALASGGTLVICPRDTIVDPALLYRALLDNDVRYAEFLPSVIRLLVAYCEAGGLTLGFLKLIAVGGEPWSPAEYQALRAVTGPGPRILNVYGVTEATVGSTFAETPDGGTGWLSIGSGLPGVTACVLDGALRPAPVGMAGEIHLAGPTLARGYRDAPGRTAERFVPMAAGARSYRTGDLGRLRPDGSIEFLGRLDEQVKVRGFRIEPGEIEAALRVCPGILDAVVVARPDDTGRSDRLAAFLLADRQPEVETLRAELARRVPDYMIPWSYTVVARFPRTAAGKIDRRSLAATAPDVRDRPYVPPRDDLELAVAEVFREVLGVAKVGAFDDFFALGGHSLLAAKAGARLRVRLGREVPIRDLLGTPTVAAIALTLAGRPLVDTTSPQPVARQSYLLSPEEFDGYADEVIL